MHQSSQQNIESRFGKFLYVFRRSVRFSRDSLRIGLRVAGPRRSSRERLPIPDFGPELRPGFGGLWPKKFLAWPPGDLGRLDRSCISLTKPKIILRTIVIKIIFKIIFFKPPRARSFQYLRSARDRSRGAPLEVQTSICELLAFFARSLRCARPDLPASNRSFEKRFSNQNDQAKNMISITFESKIKW